MSWNKSIEVIYLNWLDIILKFDGIIGTILGVVATLITTEAIKHLGKVYFYFYDWSVNYYGENEYGLTTITKDINSSEYCCYELRMQIYNSTDEMKTIKDLQIEFCLKDEKIYGKPNNKELAENREVYIKYKDFNYINIPPKQLLEINMNGSIQNENMIEVANVEKIYLSAKDYKNRKIRKLIKRF